MCWVGGAHTKGIVVRTLSGYSLNNRSLQI
jgi:hypothetical protein